MSEAKLFRFTFPIDNYYGDDVFEKHVYFTGSRCPTHEEVISRLQALWGDEQKMLERPEEFYVVTQEFQQCLLAITCLRKGERLPFLAGNMVMENTFCDHPKWGRCPISVQRIDPEEFEGPFRSFFAKQEGETIEN